METTRSIKGELLKDLVGIKVGVRDTPEEIDRTCVVCTMLVYADGSRMSAVDDDEGLGSWVTFDGPLTMAGSLCGVPGGVAWKNAEQVLNMVKTPTDGSKKEEV